MEYADNGDLLQAINEHIQQGNYFAEKEVWNALIQVRGSAQLFCGTHPKHAMPKFNDLKGKLFYFLTTHE